MKLQRITIDDNNFHDFSFQIFLKCLHAQKKKIKVKYSSKKRKYNNYYLIINRNNKKKKNQFVLCNFYFRFQSNYHTITLVHSLLYESLIMFKRP